MSAAISNSAASAAAAASATASNPFASMSSSDFIKIMMSELQNQDPTQPEDSTAILNQLSSLQNINSQLSLQSQLQALVSQNSLASASGLIGKMVAGQDANGNNLSGIVTSISVQNGAPVLNLDSGQTLTFSQVTQISPVSGTGSGATATGTGPTTPTPTSSAPTS